MIPMIRLHDKLRPMTTATVDPELLAKIESAGAPVRMPPLPLPPRDMPGTKGALGNFLLLVNVLRGGLEHVLEYRAKVGDVYQVALAGRPQVVTWDADEIHRIVRNEEQLWSTAMAWNAMMFSGLDARGGNSGMLVTLDFDDHRVARKLVQPAFTTSAIEGYLRVADGHFRTTVDEWVKRGHVVFKPEIRALLARVAGEIFTGIRDPEKLAVIDRALSDFWNAMVAIAKNPWLSPTYRRSRKGLETLLRTFLELVPERRKGGGEDLFSRMCKLEDADDEAIVRSTITIMFGAFDTTSAAMTSMGYLVAKHPEWQEKLRAEAMEAGDGPLDVATMRGMKHHEWVWKETLRLVPLVLNVARCALRDTKVCGYDLEAGTLVAPMTGGVGRHPKWWTNPDTFDPERFSPERAEDRRHPGIFNPFGAGAHACVGMQLANMEMKQFWHRMLRACRLRLAPDYEGRHSLAPFGIITGDVRLALEPLST